jgi:peptide deformylase
MKYRILHFGEEPLREEAQPIAQIDDEIRQLVQDMFETMHASNGVGLAAPQIGMNKRVFVIEIENRQMVFVNPKILKVIGKETCEEGCLSFPGLREDVQRGKIVTCEYTDIDGQLIKITAEGLLARAIQHENDHLDGIMIVDRISKARRLQIKRELELIMAGEKVEYEDDDETEEEESDDEKQEA